MLVLHIGLPKTGTTFLQHQIFRRSDQVDFVHRSLGPSEHDFALDFKSYSAAGAKRATALRSSLVAWLDARQAATPQDEPRPILVSEENISTAVTSFWTGRGAVPRQLAKRLARLRSNLPPRLKTVKVIIGIRSQDQWLASRYAESSRKFPEFGQEDFDSRMRAISQLQPLEKTYAWLDYAAVHQTFSKALGPENVFMAPMEQIFATPQPFFDALGRFIGDTSLPRLYREAASRDLAPPNQLSLGANRWALRSNGQQILLRPELQQALLSRFAASNALLSQTIGFTVAAD